MGRRRPVRRCYACKNGRHAQCEEHFDKDDDRLCPCCGTLSKEERSTKEKQIKEEKARRRREEREIEDYRNYAGAFDFYIRQLRREKGIDKTMSVGRFLPKTDEEMAVFAVEMEMPIDWVTQFVEEHREDYPEEG